MSTVKEIRVDYYALLREQRGLSSEVRSTHAMTARQLYDELRREYSFTLSIEDIRVAVKDEFAELDRVLKAGDTVVFIPPVAGG